VATVKKPSFESPQEAEEAFYRAINKSDLEGMKTVWEDSDDVVCVHPVGPRICGVESVIESWRTILGNSRNMQLRVGESQITRSGDLAIHIVHEHIRFGAKGKMHPPVVATNVYRRGESGWHMILHHASPTPEQAAEEAKTLH